MPNIENSLGVELFEERCPHCGASMKKYWHSLTPMLVHSLIKFRNAAVRKGENKVHLLNDNVDLTRHEWNNFTRLRFHGLAVKAKSEDGAGYWLLTKRGNDFIKNGLKVPKRVLTFRNRVVDHDERLVDIAEVMGSEPYLEKVFDYELEQPK